jgi:primosomal protein N'
MTMIDEHPIVFECPHCNVSLKAKLEVAGRNGRCPQCGRAIKVPEARRSGSADQD